MLRLERNHRHWQNRLFRIFYMATVPTSQPCKKTIVPPSRWRQYVLLFVVLSAMLVVGCASPPQRPDNACRIFKEKPRWHKHTRRAAKKWKVETSVLLAIMKQESAFAANAKPRRKRFLGVPLWRPSSAFGYAQALDQTWRQYKKQTNSWLAQRDSFTDAVDFIGWYMAQSRRRLGISGHDAYRHYLAYHEGWGGYSRATYKRKKWLVTVAKRVSTQARRYRIQLTRCGG